MGGGHLVDRHDSEKDVGDTAQGKVGLEKSQAYLVHSRVLYFYGLRIPPPPPF